MREILNILIKKNTISEVYIKRKYIELYNEIIEYGKSLNLSSWKEMIYCYVNVINNPPKCECGKKLSLINVRIGYRKYCSKSCSNNSTLTKEKKKLKSIKNYGVEHPMKNPEYKKDYDNKINSRYGVDNISQNINIKNKKKNTYMKNYGVLSPLQSATIYNNMVKSLKLKYGVDNISKIDKVIEKKKKINNLNYGVDYGFKSEVIKEKIRKTINNKYGVDYYVCSNENKEKITTNKKNKQINKWSKILNIDSDNIEISGNDITIHNYCMKHNSFKINRFNLYNRVVVGGVINPCTICYPISENSSIKEIELRNFIQQELKINTIKHKIDNKEVDIFLPEYGLGIEFNGLYWHSCLFKDKYYHQRKTELYNENNIQLLQIFEDEWLFKKNIIKSIICSKLNIFQEKIFARKTEVREITDNKLISDFLERNHLQGFVGSKIRLGLYYENQLVSIMTFGKKRIIMGNKLNNDNEYEMLRFCNKLNTRVIGGASKLLTYFIKKYKPNAIISYANRRYSSGELYKKLGFKYVSNSKPNYFYFKTNDMIRYYRFNFRKDKLIREGHDKSMTEYEIMLNLGYLRIYDCGNIKYKISL